MTVRSVTGIGKRLSWGTVVLASVAGGLTGQNTYVYTNNNLNGPNSVSALLVGAGGVLTPVPGSPFATGGNGTGTGLFAANRVATSIVGNFLYASNDGSGSISGFTINPATGVLTLVLGSPVIVGSAVSLAATPDNKYLIAASTSTTQIFVFSIAANGSLTPVAGSPFADPSPGDGIKISPDGRFLAVANYITDRVAVFTIGTGGALTPVPGSPFVAGNTPFGGVAASADINCQSSLLFAGVALSGSTTVDVFNIGANGALTPIAGSPFRPGVGSNSNVALLSPDGRLLFVSNQFSMSVTVFTVALNGTLTLVPGSPFALPSSAAPTGMATDPAGTFLFVADGFNKVYVFNIASNGVLTPVAGSPFSTGVAAFSFLSSLTAYPARTCVAGAGLATPDAFQVRYAANLDRGDSFIDITNNGASSTTGFPTQDGNLCVNVYAFSPDEQLIACCSCFVTPNGLVSLSVRNDLLPNTLTPGVPTSLVVKLVSTAGTSSSSCNASTAGVNTLAAGLSAWGTTIHALPVTPGTPAGTFGMTETRFLSATLSAAELTRITTLCGFIQTNGSGFGLCKACRTGGLGGATR